MANIPLSYTYLGFKLGTWDAKTSQVKMNKKAKMANKSLRQAIGYAMNVTEIERKYTSGLTFRIKTLIPAEYGDYYNDSLEGYPYSPKKPKSFWTRQATSARRVKNTAATRKGTS